MKNQNLYIHPKANPKPIAKRRYNPRASIPKAKRSDASPMHRRNGKLDALDITILVASCISFAYCILHLVTL